MGNACQGTNAVVETSYFCSDDTSKKNGDNTPNGRADDKPPVNQGKNKDIEFSISGTRDMTRGSQTKKLSSSDFPTTPQKAESEATSALLPSSTENLKDSKDLAAGMVRDKSNEEGVTNAIASKSTKEPTEQNDLPTYSSEDSHNDADAKKSTKTTNEQHNGVASVEKEGTSELKAGYSDQIDDIDVQKVAMDESNPGSVPGDSESANVEASQSEEPTDKDKNNDSVAMENETTNKFQEGDADQIDNAERVGVDEENPDEIAGDSEGTNIQSSQSENAAEQVMSSTGISNNDAIEKDNSAQTLEAGNEAKEIDNTDSILLPNSKGGLLSKPDGDSVQIDAAGIVDGQNPDKSVNIDSTVDDESEKNDTRLSNDPTPGTTIGQDQEEKEDSADHANGTSSKPNSQIVEESTCAAISSVDATSSAHSQNLSKGNATDEKPPEDISGDKLSQNSSARNAAKDDKRSTQMRKIQKSQTMNVINYPNGDVYKGDTDDDKKPHGNGKMTYSDGSNYQGAWVHGMRHGLGKVLFPDGSFYKGDFNANMFHGQGVMFWADGAYYSGEWVENQQHGQGKEVYPGGKKLRHKGLWKNGWPVRDADNDQPAVVETKVASDAEQESS